MKVLLSSKINQKYSNVAAPTLFPFGKLLRI